MISRPEYLNRILRYKDSPFVKILTGVRRSGKSTLLKMIAEEFQKEGIPPQHIVQYNFDYLEYSRLRTAEALYTELKTRLGPGRTYFFLDEIQEVEEWEKVVNTLMETENVDIYVTGSNSRMMSSEISTYLTGRYITFPVYTLSFKEYQSFRKEFTTLEDSHKELARYLRMGGFPAVHLRPYEESEVYAIVRDIYNSAIFTDIVRRNEIRKVDQLERLVRFSFNNVGQTFSAQAISKYLKSEHRRMDTETIYSYLKKLESAYILYPCRRYDLQGKEILKTQEKYYVADPAFRYSVLGYTPDSISPMLENVVYLELLRRGYLVYVGKLGAAEIDFVAQKEGNRLYIQITKEIRSKETEEREYGRLLDIPDNYPKYMLSTDDFAGGNYKGIHTMHIADFLLSGDY